MITIRRATLADCAEIAQVQVDSYRTTYVGILPQPYLDQFTYADQAQDWHDWLTTNQRGILLVAASADDGIVGYALGKLQKHPILAAYTSEVSALHIRQSHQRQGLGRHLLAAMAEQLRQQGSTALLLWVLAQNPARQFYEKLGGVLVGQQTIQIDATIMAGEVAYGWPDITRLANLRHYSLRPATADDAAFLWEMLYQALYVPTDQPRPDRTLLQDPTLAHYVAGWGKRSDDFGMIALDNRSNEPVGAAWWRVFSEADPGWGFVNANTPELSMAVLPAYRGKGIGTALLTKLIEAAQTRYPALSLSVDPQNPALRLYQRAGFVTVGTSGTSITMYKQFVTITTTLNSC